jgi:hypothetical protein
LIAREIEKQGMITVSYGLVRTQLENTKPPRSLFIKWPFGHILGEPFKREQQKTLIYDGLKMILECREPGSIIDLPYQWKRHPFKEPDFATLGV